MSRYREPVRRTRQAVELIRSGTPLKQVAEDLGVSERTLRNWRRQGDVSTPVGPRGRRLMARRAAAVAAREPAADVRRAGIEVRMCRVKGPVHDALLENGLVDLPGVQHFYDSVRAAKKGQAPDGLPVVPEAGTTAAGRPRDRQLTTSTR